MELRRRRRSKRNGISGSYYGCVFAVSAVFLTLTFFIGFSDMGTVLAENVFKPLFSDEEEQPLSDVYEPNTLESPMEAEEAQAENTVTRRVTIPAFTCHALQMGAFSEESNARNHALALAKLGAAGYVHRSDGEDYRVLSAGYLSEEDLTAVRVQLREEMIDSMPYEISTKTCTLSVSADEKTVSACEEACKYLVLLAEQLTELSIRFDRENMDVSSGIHEVQSIKTALSERIDTLSALPEGSRNAVQPLITCLEQADLKMDELIQKQDVRIPAFSSALKYLSLMYVNDLAESIDRITE